MAMIISVSIDLTKIDRSRIKEGNNGQKYYSLNINVNDEKDNYGNDASVTQNQTKEERDAKEKKVFLGNGKIVWQSDAPAAPAQAPTQAAPIVSPDDDGLPF